MEVRGGKGEIVKRNITRYIKYSLGNAKRCSHVSSLQRELLDRFVR